MNLQEHIKKVLREETYFNVSDDKYSKIIKNAILDYVDFNICGLVVSALVSFEDQYLVILIVEEQLKSSYREELQEYLNNYIPLKAIYVSVSDGQDCQNYKKNMNIQEQIRKVLKEETNQGKYTNALEDLTEVYKNEDCVCDIKISYKPDEDTYLINVKVGNKDLDNKFNGIDFRIRNYINQLRRKINEEVYDYFPISVLVTFNDTPKCSDYRNLKESDPKVGTGKKPKDSDRRLYTDENPNDTVSVKFKTKQDIVDTLNKESFKSKSHARQSQIINLIHQRLRVALERAKDPEVKKRLRTAFEYIESKKEASKRKTEEMKEGELTERCWKGYTQKGMKTMFGKRYPNCVKKKK
jgi:hypothetical protein